MVFPRRHFALNCWTEGRAAARARAAAAGALRAGAGVVVVACRAAEGARERGGTIHDRACGVSE